MGFLPTPPTPNHSTATPGKAPSPRSLFGEVATAGPLAASTDCLDVRSKTSALASPSTASPLAVWLIARCERSSEARARSRSQAQRRLSECASAFLFHISRDHPTGDRSAPQAPDRASPPVGCSSLVLVSERGGLGAKHPPLARLLLRADRLTDCPSPPTKASYAAGRV